MDQMRSERRESTEGGRTYIREPDRVIIRENGRTIVRRDESARFRYNARDVRQERRGDQSVTIVERPNGTRVMTYTDNEGRMLRRSRVGPDGREVVIIENRYDNRYRGSAYAGSYYVDLPPPRVRMPRERYIVGLGAAVAAGAAGVLIYDTLRAPPVERIERAYTLDEVRFSAPLRDRMPRVDVDTIVFESGSWEVPPDQVDKLAAIAEGINRAIQANPQEVFLIEGHTDAVGPDVDNLSLSDRRAEAVSLILTEQFQVPAENLTSQGYGEQNLKVPHDGPEQQNRRVAVRRITPLLTGNSENAGD
jgi:outer membrane protein OmpA-like peptidoglycan-associated protein